MGSARVPEIGQNFEELVYFFYEQQQAIFQGYLFIETAEEFLLALENLTTCLKEQGLNDKCFLNELSGFYQEKRQQLQTKSSELFAELNASTTGNQKKRKREASEDEYDQIEEIVAEIIARERKSLDNFTLRYKKWAKTENRLSLLNNNYHALLACKNLNLPEQQEQQVSDEKTAENKAAIEKFIAQKQQQLVWLQQWQSRCGSFCAITAEIADIIRSIAAITKNVGKDRDDKATFFNLLILLENYKSAQQKLDAYFQLINQLMTIKPLITQRDEERLKNLSASGKKEIAEHEAGITAHLNEAENLLQQFYLNTDFCADIVNDYAEKIAEAKQKILAIKDLSLSKVEKTVQQLQTLFELKLTIEDAEFFVASGFELLETVSDQTVVLLDHSIRQQLAWLQAKKCQLAQYKFYYETAINEIKVAKLWQKSSVCAEVLAKLRGHEHQKLWAEYGEQILNWVKAPLIKSALRLEGTEKTIALLRQDVKYFDDSLVETAKKIADFICCINQELKVRNLINKIADIIKEYEHLISSYGFAATLLQSEITFLQNRKDFWLNELQQMQGRYDFLMQALINKLAENPEKKLQIKQELANNNYSLYWYENLFFADEVKRRYAQAQDLVITTFLACGMQVKLIELIRMSDDISTTHQLHYQKYQNLAKEVVCSEKSNANVAYLGQAQEPVYYRYVRMIKVLYQWDEAFSNKAKEMAQSYSMIAPEMEKITEGIKNILPNPLEYQEFLQSKEGELLVNLSNSVNQTRKYAEILQGKLNKVLANLKKYPQQQEFFVYFSQTDALDEACKQWCLDKWRRFQQSQEAPSYRL